MNERLQDDEFEAVLSRGGGPGSPSAAIGQRGGKKQMQERIPTQGSWLVAFLSPGRMAAGAAILSLMIGFALGWINTIATDDPETDMAAVVYAANDVGEF
jgi:hypothetical protein